MNNFLGGDYRKIHLNAKNRTKIETTELHFPWTVISNDINDACHNKVKENHGYLMVNENSNFEV